MAAMIVWVLVICVSVALLVVTAAAEKFYVHMVIACVVPIFFAVYALRENKQALDARASEAEIAALNARYMSLVWIWGSLALFTTYWSVLQWKEAWQFVIAFVLAGALCLFFSFLLGRDAESKTEDRTLLKIARYLSVIQLGGMAAIMIGLLVDGKMWRFKTVAGLRPGSQDWAGNNIFFFGALALAAISLVALQSSKRIGQK